MAETVLVTGGAGFFGSALSISLKRNLVGAEVIALDNLHRRGAELNLPRLGAAGVRFVHADVRSLADLERVRPAPSIIIEASAEPSAQAGYDGDSTYLIQSNLFGSFHSLEMARRTGAKFIFLSSSRVYPYSALNGLPFVEEETRYRFDSRQTVAGASAIGISESFPLKGPRSLYGMTKLAAELMVEEYGDAYGLQFIIDRFGLITGPRQMARSDQGVLALWMGAHYFRRPLVYIGFGGGGKQVRDFLHVDDCCDLLLDQVRNFELYQGSRFNAGGGATHSLSLRETTALCREISGNQIEISSSNESRPADVRIYISDARQVMSINGWRPWRDARKTLGDIHQWLREEEDQVRSVLFG